MGGGESCQLLHRRFLQHEVEAVGCLTARDIHAVVGGHCRLARQAVAYDVGLGKVLQLPGTYQYVAAHHHGVQRGWGMPHDALVERALEVEQRRAG